jgi:ParB-like chromosome segregation protein Spo0J
MSNSEITYESGAAPDADFASLRAGGGGSAGAGGVLNPRLEMVPPPGHLITDKHNARTHSKRQIDQIARSIKRFGFVGAVLIDNANQIIAGHGRVQAAKQLGLDRVPVLRVTHLSAAERKAYAIADNRLAKLAGWDGEILAIELQELREVDFDIGAIGFELDDVDIVPEKGGSQAAQNTDRSACAPGRQVSRAGDVWLLGPHQLRCGDAGDEASYAAIDAAIRRWQRAAGKAGSLAGAGKSFAEVENERASAAHADPACGQAATKQEAA